MNEASWKLAERFIDSSYVKQALDASKNREKLIQQLLEHKKMPEIGWDEPTIELFLVQLSLMDSNNFISNCGAGEREARFASDIVAKRHFRFGHGIGRSGDLTETQPKAAGSSLMYKITNSILQDLMKLMGIETPIECLLVPVATGMAMVLSMLSLRHTRSTARYVIWSRIDQKSCFKCILTARYIPVIIDTIRNKEQLISNIELIENKIQELGSDNILCVISTMSCFAPRGSDSIEEIAKVCNKMNIPHLVNNAYGLQCKSIMKRIQRAKRVGRLDVFVQSTDKNLLVPVGGAIIATFDKNLLQSIAKTYPGRASSSPVMDVFITLLNIGKVGYQKLVDERELVYIYLKEKLSQFAQSIGEKILDNSENPISVAMTLSNIPREHLTKLGSMLFVRCVSGTRVVTAIENKVISGYEFQGWGSHCSNFATPYLTAAASVGMRKTDVDVFINRLQKVLSKYKSGNQSLSTETVNSEDT